MMKLLLVTWTMMSLASATRIHPRHLLRNAVPVDRHGQRRLDQQNQFQITGAYSIQFNNCLSLKTQPENDLLFSQDNIAYTKSGEIVSQKSFVIFNVCQTEKCVYSGQENLYMVDLASYMESLVGYMPQKMQDYCDACQQAYDYCFPQQNDDQANQAQQNGDDQANQAQQNGDDQANQAQQNGDDQANQQAQNNNYNGRRLANNNNNNNNQGQVEYINCNKCSALQCFDNMNQQNNYYNQQQYTDQDVADWVEQMAQCQQTNYQWNNQNLYSGFICNADGSGVEIGLFLDEYCETYTSKRSYKTLVAGTADSTLAAMSGNVVTYPFVNNIDCAEINYQSPANAQQNNDDNYQAAQANQYCVDVIDNNAVDLAQCGNYQAEQNYYEEDTYYPWYVYELTQQEKESNYAACKVVQAFSGEYSPYHVYNPSETTGSGSLYAYNSKKGMSGGGKFGVVLLVLVVVGAAVYVATSSSKAKADSKTQPLVEGAMA